MLFVGIENFLTIISVNRMITARITTRIIALLYDISMRLSLLLRMIITYDVLTIWIRNYF